jgi:hypothetical protein
MNIRRSAPRNRLTIGQVEGQERPMSFTQTFQLRKDGSGTESWYVFNDIFRLVYPAQ